MIGRRLVAAFFGATLALGGVAATAVSASAQTAPAPPTETPAPPANCDPVASMVTLPGVGTVSFVVDPCTGAISEVVVAPVDGVTVGDPVMTSEGVKIQITAADGTVSVLEIEAEIDDSGFKVETEIETGDDLGESGNSGGNDGTDSGEHGTSPNTGPGNSGESHSGPGNSGESNPPSNAGSGTPGGGGHEGGNTTPTTDGEGSDGHGSDHPED